MVRSSQFSELKDLPADEKSAPIGLNGNALPAAEKNALLCCFDR
jgi:hypothetical protein